LTPSDTDTPSKPAGDATPAASHEAGGDVFHNGGEQFASKSDPDWQTIADWVRNGK